MLWFTSKLLAGIFSLSSSKKPAAKPAPTSTLSNRSSLATLVNDELSASSSDSLKNGMCVQRQRHQVNSAIVTLQVTAAT